MKKKGPNKQNKLIPSESSFQLYTTPDGNAKIEVRLENETAWLTQGAMAELFQTTAQNITIHLKEIYVTGELTEEATCKESLQVQHEGQRGAESLADDAALKSIEQNIAQKKPQRVVCLDESFAGNDQIKANVVQIFKTKGVTSFKPV